MFFDRGLISIFALTKKDACKTVVVLLVICKRLKCIWNTDLYSKKKKKWEKLICFFSFILKIFHPEAIFEFMRENSIIHFFKASFFSAKIQKTDFAICHQIFSFWPKKNIFGAKIQSWFFQFELNFSTKNEIFRIFV